MKSSSNPFINVLGGVPPYPSGVSMNDRVVKNLPLWNRAAELLQKHWGWFLDEKDINILNSTGTGMLPSDIVDHYTMHAVIYQTLELAHWLIETRVTPRIQQIRRAYEKRDKKLTLEAAKLSSPQSDADDADEEKESDDERALRNAPYRYTLSWNYVMPCYVANKLQRFFALYVGRPERHESPMEHTAKLSSAMQDLLNRVERDYKHWHERLQSIVVDEIRALLYKRGLFVRRRSADGQLLHDTLEELFTFEYHKRPSKIFMNIAVDYEVVSRALNCRRLKAGSSTEFESIWDVAKHNQSIRSSVLLPRTNPNIVLHYILAVITLDGGRRVVEIMDSLHDPFTYQYYRDLLQNFVNDHSNLGFQCIFDVKTETQYFLDDEDETTTTQMVDEDLQITTSSIRRRAVKFVFLDYDIARAPNQDVRAPLACGYFVCMYTQLYARNSMQSSAVDVQTSPYCDATFIEHHFKRYVIHDYVRPLVMHFQANQQSLPAVPVRQH